MAGDVFASRINYWNAHKPVHFITSHVLFGGQQNKCRTALKASLQCIQPLQKIRRIDLWNVCPISQYIKATTPQRQQMSNSFHMHSKQGIVWEVPLRSLCLTLKPLCVYHKLLLYAAVKKEWGHKGVKR